jgi:hypothetical protein
LKSKLINQSDLMKNAVNIKKIVLNKPSSKNVKLFSKEYNLKQMTERQNSSLEHFHIKLKRVT